MFKVRSSKILKGLIKQQEEMTEIMLDGMIKKGNLLRIIISTLMP